ncbi:MAG: PIN domain-containing protein [Chloroflexi bacterium]|nr:PIN domain-containing protein [Chloroflexota bacterium]
MGPKARPRVFLDSNVIFSGLYSAQGAPGQILEHFLAGRIGVVISQQVLEEVVRTVGEKLPVALPALRRLLESAPPEIVADPPLGEVVTWAGALARGDAAILAAAVAARADCLVTGDRRFFAHAIVEEAGLRIVTPAQFLAGLKD